MFNKKTAGFTLIEILLVVASIAILAGIVILAINPSKQLADARNAQRENDVRTILDAVYQYAIDNNGSFPGAITTSAQNICKDDAADCTSLADITTELTDNQTYLVSIPRDPTGSTDNATGYTILKTSDGRLTVAAPSAEQSVVISATR